MIPLKITWRNVAPSPAIEENIREKAEKLDQFIDEVTNCRVVLEVPHRHQRKGKLYHVRLDIKVPGGEVVINREPDKRSARADVYVSIQEAFDAARRQLQDHVRRRRGDIKGHELPPHGRVDRLFPEEGYGFLSTLDGRQIYFHKNSVLEGRFEDLTVGTAVHFTEEDGEKGPQAASVKVVGPPAA